MKTIPSFKFASLYRIIAVCSMLLLSVGVFAQDKTKSGETERTDVAFDLATGEEEINILKTFLHSNNKSFSITIYDFKDEKVQVIISKGGTNEQLYSLNLQPTEDIFHAELLTTPLPKGTYTIVVKGESRVIPKVMTVE
jgi:hypothetical protein